MTHIRSFVPAVYDITVAVPRDQPSPTMLRILSGQSSVVSLCTFLNSLLASSVP